MLNVGQLLYQLLMGYSPRLPLSPFDDTTWQARHLPFLAQGAVSVGLRYLLTALFQAPVHERFMTPEGPSFLGLHHALDAWSALMNSLGSVIDQQNPESLAAFSAALPAPYRFNAESTAAQAIWYDLWLRIHQADAASSGDTSQHVARSDAMLRAKVDFNEEARAQELIQQALAADTAARAQEMLAGHRAVVQHIAETRDVTLWALWQHLGRWHTLLELNTPREVIRQIGGALHRPSSEDHAQTLDILENTLLELAADEVLREVRLRQAAIAYRQAGETANFALRYQRELENLPYYLRLPSPANQDFSLLPFTLQGQIVGALTDTVSRAADALGAGNNEVALALLEFARALPITVGEQLVFQDRLAALEDTQRFLNETPGAHIAQQFAEGARLLRQALIQHNDAVRERIETALLNLGTIALERVKLATDNRDWASVRAAYDAHRVLTERDSRHLLESLQAAHQKETRTLQTSAVLNAYEQIQDTYRQLFTTLKQWPLADILNPDRDNRDRQQAARAVMNALNHALELGLPMNDLIANDESTRQQWQQLISDALAAIQRTEHITQDVESLRQRLQGDGGFGSQLQALAASVAALQGQIDGSSTNVPSIMTQLQQIRAQIADIEKGVQAQVDQSKRELRVSQDDIQRQLEAHDITIQRHTQQISGASNLLQDTRERLTLIEHELLEIQKHESAILCSYLDAQPDPTSYQRINAVLDAVDGLVYAMRRCPVEAYDEGTHAAWLARFHELKTRFEAMASSRQSWRDRRSLKNQLRTIRDLLAEVEAEATAKAAANKRIFTRPVEPPLSR